MALTALEELLQASMGLSAPTIGSAAIARAVEERRSICGLRDLHAYLERVRTSGTELQALTEAVVVPETWFFRDPHAFIALARLVIEVWLPAHPAGALSLLSLPCSTGEEPYSMAMALLDAGVSANRFHVDAVDISGRNIAHSVRAVYGRNSFRGSELAFRDRHFDEAPGGFRLREAIRQQVRFQQGNLLSADLIQGTAGYDVIFCRNVLVYFDRQTQDRALDVLNSLLHSTGTLFVAPAETALPGSHGLVSTKEPLAFAFRKASMVPPVPTPAPIRPVAQALAAYRHVSAAPLKATLTPGPRLAAQVSRPTAAAADLDEAMRLADQGHFAEAATHCEKHLRRYGSSAAALYLMGLVRDASGNHAEAATYYRKALYLDPDHYDTQIHFALLMEKQGDSAGARVLRERARRLEQGTKGVA